MLSRLPVIAVCLALAVVSVPVAAALAGSGIQS